MTVTYDTFTEAFLAKISEYEFIRMPEAARESITDGYLKKSVSAFRPYCELPIVADDLSREYQIGDELTGEITDDDFDEINDIVSEGMVVQWMKTYLNRQEILENAISTREYSVFSPSELQKQIRTTYNDVKNHHIQMMREYSFNHGDLTRLHL